MQGHVVNTVGRGVQRSLERGFALESLLGKCRFGKPGHRSGRAKLYFGLVRTETIYFVFHLVAMAGLQVKGGRYEVIVGLLLVAVKIKLVIRVVPCLLEERTSRCHGRRIVVGIDDGKEVEVGLFRKIGAPLGR